MFMGLTWKPVLDIDRCHWRIWWDTLHQRPEWLRPVGGQFLHKSNTVLVAGWDSEAFRFRPREDDLAEVVSLHGGTMRRFEDFNTVRKLFT